MNTVKIFLNVLSVQPVDVTQAAQNSEIGITLYSFNPVVALAKSQAPVNVA